MTRQVGLGAAMILFLALVLTGCGAGPAPAPTATAAPSPTAAPPAPATAALAASPAPAASQAPAAAPAPTAGAADLPEGWQRETNEQVSIAIPPGWVSFSFTGEDAQTAFDELKRNDPRLANMIGSAEALQGTAFWAFGPVDPDFTDNLNIRRSPLGSQRVTDVQQVLDALLPEYEKIGLKVTSTDATLRVHGFPAARVTYSFPMSTAEGQSIEVRGRQVIVATDTDLWVLSFSTTPEREGSMAGVFEQSALSFEPE